MHTLTRHIHPAATALLCLLLLAGCPDDEAPAGDGGLSDGATTGDGALPPSTATLDEKGGRLRVGGHGPVQAVRLVLPAGTLASGEKATVTLKHSRTQPKDQPKLSPAVWFFELGLDVQPESLFTKIHKAATVELELDPSHPAFSDPKQKALVAKDPVKWANDYLLRTRPLVESDVSELKRCKKTSGGTELFKIKVMGTGWVKTSKGTEIEKGVVVAAPLATLKLFGAERKGRVWRWKSGIWHAGSARMGLSFPHAHIGRINMNYYPVSVRATAPDHNLPTDPNDRDKAWACIEAMFNKTLDTLRAKGFRSLKVDNGKAEWEVAIFDFTAGTTEARASYSGRYMELQTKYFDHAHYPSKTKCFAKTTAPLLLAVAHELFHWQQGAYMANQDESFWWWRNQASIATRAMAQIGPHTVTTPQNYRINDWFAEATAHYFAYEMARHHPLHPGYFRHGLTGYPLTIPAWFPNGSDIIVDRFWDYTRVPYFKYLFDQEDKSGGDELVLLAGLLNATGAYLEKLVNAVPKTKANKYPKVSIGPAVKTWAQARGRDWFGFSREVALLRGCASMKKCPLVPAAKSRPFGRLPGTTADPYGNKADPKYWEGRVPTGDMHEQLEEPWWGTVDKGWTKLGKGESVLHNGKCRFDTVTRSYQLSPAARKVAETKSPKKGTVTLTLPDAVQQHLAGVRVEVMDNLEYQVKNRYAWKVKLGKDCSPDLQMEAWIRTEKSGTIRPLASGTSSLSFITEQPKKGEGTKQHVSLLIGNVAWAASVNRTKACTAELSIELSTCPCTSMPIVKGPGGAKDLVLHCVEGGKSFAFCDAKGFLAKGLLSALEWERCYKDYAAMSTLCKLSPKKPK